MAIHVPGYRPRNHRVVHHNGAKKNIVAVLSLTAMVDMFTVLTVFLLQNYNPETGAVLEMPQELVLPQASKHRELEPAHVVVISGKEISFEKQVIASTAAVRGSPELLIAGLHDRLKRSIEIKYREKTEGLGVKFQNAIDAAKSRKAVDDREYSKVTIQADKSVEFDVIKKIMHTVSEAGASEINFAILQKAP